MDLLSPSYCSPYYVYERFFPLAPCLLVSLLEQIDNIFPRYLKERALPVNLLYYLLHHNDFGKCVIHDVRAIIIYERIPYCIILQLFHPIITIVLSCIQITLHIIMSMCNVVGLLKSFFVVRLHSSRPLFVV